MPANNIFVAFTELERNIRNLREKEKFPHPNWKEAKSFASKYDAILIIYEIKSGTCNKHIFSKSLKTPGRIIIFDRYSRQDRRIRNERIKADKEIRIQEGRAFGIFDITHAMQDSSDRIYGDYSPSPNIRAARVFIYEITPDDNYYCQDFFSGKGSGSNC